MKNKNRLVLSYIRQNLHFKLLINPLLVILMGVFLLPNIAYFSTITEESIINLVNEERVNSGLEKVTANQLLTKAAYKKGKDLLEAQIFSHSIDDKRFSEWIKNAGYQYSYAGENLAINFVTSEGALKAWLASPTHKKNILNEKFKETGVAVLEGNFQGQNTTLIVQIFASPLNNNFVRSLDELNPRGLSANNEEFTALDTFDQESMLSHSTITLMDLNLAQQIKSNSLLTVNAQEIDVSQNQYIKSQKNNQIPYLGIIFILGFSIIITIIGLGIYKFRGQIHIILARKNKTIKMPLR